MIFIGYFLCLGFLSCRSEDVNQCPEHATPCQHCENTIGSSQCKCYLGYGGQDCSEWTGCTPESCENGGYCIEKWEGYDTYRMTRIIYGVPLIKCSCANAYRGDFCEKEDRCYSKPCGKGGKCRNEDEGFVCDCFPGLTGSLCQERDFSVCQGASSCSNRGECTEVARREGGFEISCSCDRGFSGSRCQYDFYHRYFEGQASFLQREKEHKEAAIRAFFDKMEEATLHTDFQGMLRQCRATPVDCGPPNAIARGYWLNPCHNGGTCELIFGYYSHYSHYSHCTCPPEWSGSTCEEEVAISTTTTATSPPPPPPTTTTTTCSCQYNIVNILRAEVAEKQRKIDQLEHDMRKFFSVVNVERTNVVVCH